MYQTILIFDGACRSCLSFFLFISTRDLFHIETRQSLSLVLRLLLSHIFSWIFPCSLSFHLWTSLTCGRNTLTGRLNCWLCMFEPQFLVLCNLASGFLDPCTRRTYCLRHTICLGRARSLTLIFHSIGSWWHHLWIEALLDLSLGLGWEHFGGKIVCSWDTCLIVHRTLCHRLHICKLGCRSAKAIEWNCRDLFSATIEACLADPSWGFRLI